MPKDFDLRGIFCVIPAYNEEKVIRSTLEPLLRACYSIVVVDDGSTDATWALLQELPVHALRHAVNLGQGAALQTGMTYALGKGAEIIVHFDADGQHRVQDLEALLEPIRQGTADVVLGSRFLRHEDRCEIPALKRILLRAAVFVNRLLTGLMLTDAHNGFRAFSRQAAEKIFLKENRFSHATEIVQQIRDHKLRYVERPTKIRYSEYSMAKGQSLWNAFNIVIDLLLRRIFK